MARAKGVDGMIELCKHWSVDNEYCIITRCPSGEAGVMYRGCIGLLINCINSKYRIKSNEIINLPYSVYSHERYEELLKLLNEMGYESVKIYPDGMNWTERKDVD